MKQTTPMPPLEKVCHLSDAHNSSPPLVDNFLHLTRHTFGARMISLLDLVVPDCEVIPISGTFQRVGNQINRDPIE